MLYHVVQEPGHTSTEAWQELQPLVRSLLRRGSFHHAVDILYTIIQYIIYMYIIYKNYIIIITIITIITITIITMIIIILYIYRWAPGISNIFAFCAAFLKGESCRHILDTHEGTEILVAPVLLLFIVLR